MLEYRMNRKMANESPLIRLPGRLYRKQAGWWWNVQLPGEKSPRDRALRPEGARRATTDRRLAEEIAFHLWQQAVRVEAIAEARAQEAARMPPLRAHFREKVKALRDVIASAEARAEAETAERAKLEVKLNSLRNQLSQMAPCECCGRSVPQSELQPIDSGQSLCRSCTDNLHRAAQRQSFQERRADNGRNNTEDRRPIPTARDSRREPSSVLRSASSNEFQDLLTGRNTHGSDVLYTEAGRP
jgi:hypothetical protein